MHKPLASRLSLLVLLGALAGCAAPAAVLGPVEEPPAPFSLVGEAVLDEAAVARLLDAEVVIPPDARVAVLQLPGVAQARGTYYRSREEALVPREATLNVLRGQMIEPGRVGEIEMLPALLVPNEPAVPVLREIAVRLQADLLLVFRASGDLFQADRVFRSDRFDARATCEAVLLDVRTGAFPFTTVVTRRVETVKTDEDLTNGAAASRAVQEAELDAIGEMARQVGAFLDRQPGR